MKKLLIVAAGALALSIGVIVSIGANQPSDAETITLAASDNVATDTAQAGATSSEGLEIATFAGGCFWCVEATFEKVEGVTRAVSGYAGGTTKNPTYQDVGSGKTGHTETVQIFYDPAVVSYAALLHRFWREIDPTDGKGQFVDRGSVYRPAIFYHDETQKTLAEQSLAALAESARFSKPLAVELLPYEKFWEAEDYHQDYYKKSTLRYKVYRRGSGRDQFLEKVWGDELNATYQGDETDSNTSMQIAPGGDSKGFDPESFVRPDKPTLKKLLTPEQFRVALEDGTERPYMNKYWNNKEPGIYVDIISGEPLFSSADKFRSGTGWPSFTQPLNEAYIVEETDFKIGWPRTEVRSKYGDAHLGHVFKDGPAPTGLRYCMNSAALRFIPADELAEAGYAEFADKI